MIYRGSLYLESPPTPTPPPSLGRLWSILPFYDVYFYVFMSIYLYIYDISTTNLYSIISTISVFTTYVYVYGDMYRPLARHGNAANLEDKTKEMFSSGN